MEAQSIDNIQMMNKLYGLLMAQTVLVNTTCVCAQK